MAAQPSSSRIEVRPPLPRSSTPFRHLAQITAPLFVPAVLLIAAAGLWWSMASKLSYLWILWTTDSLRSAGILIPPTSALLCFFAWRGTHWNRQAGNWWGLGLVAGTMVAAQRGPLIPTGLLLWAYASGVVLLFAGKRRWRQAFFPLALLVLVNPVPQLFQAGIDLPLQYAAADAARHFAVWLGETLHGEQLKLMFSPALGLFIAPGCDGLRGAVAMGLLTLVAGYLYALPTWLHGLYVAGAVLLAYVFNLLRLCGLVLCYRLALDFAPLADHLVAADYVIGTLLFFMAAAFVLALPRLGSRACAPGF